MKNIIILSAILIISLMISIIFYFNYPDFDNDNRIGWKYKEKEIRSRLLSIPVILYHNIDGGGNYSISLDMLRSHFQLIKDRNIKVISLKDLIERLEKPAPFKKKVIVITFDDGYYSLYLKLLPLAKEFGYPITVFVYTKAICSRGANCMTWDMLKEMDMNGIDIQSHSISHADLSELSKDDDLQSKKQLFEEIYLSKRIIELYLGKEISFFAFPEGKYNLNIIEMSLNAGYKRVFSTDEGSNILTRDNYCLRRQHIKKNYSINLFDTIILDKKIR